VAQVASAEGIDFARQPDVRRVLSSHCQRTEAFIAQPDVALAVKKCGGVALHTRVGLELALELEICAVAATQIFDATQAPVRGVARDSAYAGGVGSAEAQCIDRYVEAAVQGDIRLRVRAQ
jgi:hypothetical protein